MVVHPQLTQLVPHTPEATVLTKRLGIRVLLEYRPKKRVFIWNIFNSCFNESYTPLVL